MKKFFSLLLVTIILLVSMCACGNSNETHSLGDTIENNGVSFTLNDFAFAKWVDEETYGPYDGENSGWGPNEGYIWGWLNYTVKNDSKDAVLIDSDIKVVIEYGDGYIYGANDADYERRETPQHNTDSYTVSPLMIKSYNHIVESIPTSITENMQDVKVTVTINSKDFTYLIPASEIVVNNDTWSK